jgi:hypothetical protein
MPHAFAGFDVPQVVDAFGVMLGLAVHDGIERLQFPIGRKNGVDVNAASVRPASL